MKRLAMFLLATSFVLPALAQAPPPRNVDLRPDRHCREAHPGDTVHYSLTIRDVEPGREVLADLQMRMGRDHLAHPWTLPAPDFRGLGGGGSAKADPSVPDLFHFAFRVPKEIYSGVYRGVGVFVKSDAPASLQTPDRVDVTHHTEKQARGFCLVILSDFGETRGNQPEVTEFHPGEIVPRQ